MGLIALSTVVVDPAVATFGAVFTDVDVINTEDRTSHRVGLDGDLAFGTLHEAHRLSLVGVLQREDEGLGVVLVDHRGVPSQGSVATEDPTVGALDDDKSVGLAVAALVEGLGGVVVLGSTVDQVPMAVFTKPGLEGGIVGIVVDNFRSGKNGAHFLLFVSVRGKLNMLDVTFINLKIVRNPPRKIIQLLLTLTLSMIEF